jgi:DNA replication protein DnaC
MTDAQDPRRPSAAPAKKIVLDRAWLRGEPGSAPPARVKAPSCSLRASQRTCCGGKGYVIGTRGAIAHADLCRCVVECPACFGRARLVDGNDSKPCRQPAPNVVANLINAALIPARYADASLERFQNFSGNGERVLAEIGRWKQRFTPDKSQGLVLSGPVGVGKTYLLAALAKDLAERGLSVRFTDFFQLLGELKAGFSEGKADAAQLAPLIDVDVLFIDELGKGRNNDFELTVLDQLVCGRYNQSKTIIASTNYLLTQAYTAHAFNHDLDRPAAAGSGSFVADRFEPLEARIGQRIFSRLREMTQFVDLDGEDFRRRAAAR